MTDKDKKKWMLDIRNDLAMRMNVEVSESTIRQAIKEATKLINKEKRHNK